MINKSKVQFFLFLFLFLFLFSFETCASKFSPAMNAVSKLQKSKIINTIEHGKEIYEWFDFGKKIKQKNECEEKNKKKKRKQKCDF